MYKDLQTILLLEIIKNQKTQLEKESEAIMQLL